MEKAKESPEPETAPQKARETPESSDVITHLPQEPQTKPVRKPGCSRKPKRAQTDIITKQALLLTQVYSSLLKVLDLLKRDRAASQTASLLEQPSSLPSTPSQTASDAQSDSQRACRRRPVREPACSSSHPRAKQPVRQRDSQSERQRGMQTEKERERAQGSVDDQQASLAGGV